MSDTLTSKILLGLFGNVPAYDRFFVSAMKLHCLNNTHFCRDSLLSVVDFYNEYKEEFDKCRQLFCHGNCYYTPMKLIDMYF
ncbi:hypothetical protein D3C75_1034260 [compost metagenome]